MTKKKVGIVISTFAQKTITVKTLTRYQHKKYAKSLVKTKCYMVHDKYEKCKLGDVVFIEESAPFSKCKTWTLTKILNTY